MSHQVALSFEDGVTRFITVNPFETVADASYKARINIPLDCRDGACGTCKSFCESGTFDPGDFIDDAMTEDELEQGYCLPCQALPESDMVIKIPTTSDVAKTAPSATTATVTGVEKVSDSTFALRMTVEDRESLAFLPGQYVNVAVPGADAARSYSFSNGTSEEELSFLIRNTPGGVMTTYLDERCEVGDELELTGPMGSFFLREADRPLLLLAGGTGLAPILSMLRSLCDGDEREVHLIYGVSRVDDLVGLSELDVFKAENSRFTYDTVVSDPDSGHEHIGYVTSLMGAEQLRDGEIDVYLCGPPPMVDSVREHLDSVGTTPVNFYYEKFTPAAGTSTEETAQDTVAVTTVEDDRATTVVSGPGFERGEQHLSLAASSDAQFDARMALEFGALELVIGRLSEQEINEFRALAESANAYIDGNTFVDAEAFTKANNAFHEYLFVCTSNDSLLHAYRSLEVTKYMNTVLPPANWVSEHIVPEHLQLVDALDANDRDAARYIVRHHTEHAKETMHAAVIQMEDEE